MRPLLVALVIAMVGAIGSSRADANANAEARAIAADGFDAYDRGDYTAAIAHFERANALAPTAGLLFNIAQTYRKLGPSGCERALAYYRRYQRARAGAADERLEARIAEMTACVEAQRPTPSETTTVATRATEPESEPEPTSDEPRPFATPMVDQPAPSRRRTGWVVLGVAATSLATSAVTGVMAVNRHSVLSAGCPGGVCPSSLDGTVGSYNRLRVTAFATGTIGVAAAAVGTYLVLRRKPSAKATTTAIQPVASRRSLGVRWTF